MSKPKQIITLLGFLQYVLHLAFRRIDGVNDFWGEEKTLKRFLGIRKASSSWKIYTPWPMNFASGQGGHYKVYGGPSKGPCIMHSFDDSIGHPIHSSEVEGSDPKKKMIAISNHILQKKRTGVHVRHIFFDKFCKKTFEEFCSKFTSHQLVV